jgi:hypothetical protein
LIFTLDRYAVCATERRLNFDKKALSETLDNAKIDSSHTLIDLDDAGRKQIGLKVHEKLNMSRGVWMSRKIPSIGRLGPSKR